MVRALLALIVVLALVPTVEVVEQAVHLIEHGAGVDEHDLGHHDHGDDGANGCAELSHLSGAGLGPVSDPRVVTAAAPSAATSTLDYLAVDAWRDRGSPPPPHRPPIG